MKRAVYDRYGGPEALRLVDAPVPVPTSKQVLVRQASSSVNGGDEHARAGHAKVMTGRGGFPKGLGMDVVGTVEQVGADAPGGQVGDLVWGVSVRSDANAEYVAIDANRIAPAPTNLDPRLLGGMPAVGATALQALGPRYASLRAGESVLIRGGAGGVGTALVQLAHHRGARVTALVAEPTFKGVRALGADTVVDYRMAQPADLGPFDVIVDTVGIDLPAWRDQLAPRGRFVTITIDFAHPFRSIFTLATSAVYGSRRIRQLASPPRTDTMAELTGLVENGVLHPVIDSTFPLSRIADAHARAGHSGLLGKVVLSIGD